MSRQRKNRECWESAYMNNRTYQYYYDRLMELAISMFEWKNLPPSIDPRFLELTLFSKGYAVFFKDKDLDDFVALTCMITGKWDIYRTPIDRRAYATNGYNKALDNTDSVLIYNNYLRMPSMKEIELFAERLYKLDRTIDVNINAQKTPVVISCTEAQRLTMKQLYMQWSGFEPFIFGDTNLDLNTIKVLNTNAPFVADKIQQLKTQIWNEAMTYLGISNVNTTKKERLITDEVTRELGSTVASKYTRLNARKDACKKINEMFNLNIDVEYREDFMFAEMVADSEHQVKGGIVNE